MATFIKVNLLIISIILFEFLWLVAAKADETMDYECPSVAGAALEAGYSLRAFDNDLWEFSKNEDSAFYILENPEVCSYKIFANILSDDDLDLSDFINEWHKEKLIGKIYTDERGFVFENTVLLPQASEELLKINISVFNRSANNLLEGINEHVAEISLTETEDEKDIKGNWFKAYIKTCVDSEDSCKTYADTYGPYKTHAECLERTKEMQRAIADFITVTVKSWSKCEESI